MVAGLLLSLVMVLWWMDNHIGWTDRQLLWNDNYGWTIMVDGELWSMDNYYG